MQKILSLKNVTAGYNEHVVIRNIDFDIYKKDFTAIIGPNGSGKTTLLKVILRILKPFSGNIQYQSTKNIGYLPQLHAIDKNFPITVENTVLSGLISKKGLFKKFSKTDKQKAHQMLEKLDVIDLKDKSIGELSGGQAQRIFLARALVSSPEMLILDEPNTYIDESIKSSLFDILKKLNKEITILLVSHDIGIVLPVVKNIACLNVTLKYHGDKKNLDEEIICATYNCPFELIGHGKIPHRIIGKHIHK